MTSKRDRLLLAGLLFLSVVPSSAGIVRLASLANRTNLTAENARFFAAPLPVALHIVAVVLFGVLGAFQFPRTFRRTHFLWHRRAGRLLIPAGVVAALSGLWLTESYPHVPGDGPTLYFIRWLVGAAMLTFLFMAVRALSNRRYVDHGAWMIRAYALGMGAGTQVFTHVPWLVLVGPPRGLVRDGLMAAGWLINGCAAEWILRRAGGGRVVPSPSARSHPVPAHLGAE